MRPSRERAEVFEETAAQLGLQSAVIVEKDFWVCWSLAQLFDDGEFAALCGVPEPLVFKGGTSLSKVYGLIDRFSEDIDLVVDRTAIDPTLPDPFEVGISKREGKRRVEALGDQCAEFIARVVQPFLTSRCAAIGEAKVEASSADGQKLFFAYPRALDARAYAGFGYVPSTVLLEFGARGQLTPAQGGEVRPFVADVAPQLFSRPSTRVWALSVERTFWEKATILHAAAHKGKVGEGERQSRHYADLATLSKTPAGTAALADDALLAEVADHKARFFPSAGANYGAARRGTLRLVPSDGLLRELEADYQKMRGMYQNEPLAWAQVVSRLQDVEAEFNGR